MDACTTQRRKNAVTLNPSILFFAGLLTFLFSLSVRAAVPSTFTYQGSLKQNGSPVNGTYQMEFRLTNSAGTESYWTSGPRMVDVAEGLYRVELSPSGVDWAGKDPYIETKVEGNLLLPREKLTSAPYAYLAKDVVNGAVNEMKLAASVAGTGLIGGAGSPLAVNVDNSTLETNSDTVQIKNNGVTNAKIVSMDAAKLTGGPLATSIINAMTSLKFAGFETLKILQIQVYTTNAGGSLYLSTNFTDTNLQGSFTPKLSSSKVLLIAVGSAGKNPNDHGFVTLARNGINLAPTSAGFSSLVNSNNYNLCLIAYDSPGTTSPVTYSLQVRTQSGIGTINFPELTGGLTPTAVMLAVELAQ